MLNFKSRRARLIKKAVVSAMTAAAIMIGTVASAGVTKSALADDEYKADVHEVSKDKLTGKTVLLHTGDVGGAVDGYAKLAALKNDLESSGAEVVMADCGNYTQEGTGDDRFRTVDALMLMTSMGYTVATAGDAELAEGYDHFRNDISGAKFRLVCANVYKDDKSILTPGYLHKTGSGLKIGFLGLSDAGETDGVRTASGKDMYVCAKEQVDSLKKNGADLIVGLTHIGMKNAEQLYDNVGDIDFILDGNADLACTEGAGGEPIQSVGGKFAYIGAVVIDKEGGISDRYLISTDSLASDAALKKTADKIKERLSSSVDVASGNDIAGIIADYNSEKTADDEASADDKSETDSKDAKASADDKSVSDSKDSKASTEDKSGADSKDSKASADDKSGADRKDAKTSADDKSVSDSKDAKASTEDKNEAESEEAETVSDAGNGSDNDKADNGSKEEVKTSSDSAAEITLNAEGKYEVVKGDCLWKIAERHLGDGSRWGEIYELNSDIISNPSLIYIGQQLVLPPG